MTTTATAPKSNRIPRRFDRITVTMHTETSHDKPGDVLHVYKNNSGYLALNTRTGIYAYMFAAMLRNAEICTITSIE